MNDCYGMLMTYLIQPIRRQAEDFLEIMKQSLPNLLKILDTFP